MSISYEDLLFYIKQNLKDAKEEIERLDFIEEEEQEELREKVKEVNDAIGRLGVY